MDSMKDVEREGRLALMSIELRGVFGEAAYCALTDAEVEALAEDAVALADEDMPEETFEAAARELRRRIGGVDALASYVRCLTVKAR